MDESEKKPTGLVSLNHVTAVHVSTKSLTVDSGDRFFLSIARSRQLEKYGRRVWMPREAKGLSRDKAIFYLQHAGDEFCKLLEQELSLMEQREGIDSVADRFACFRGHFAGKIEECARSQLFF